MAAAATPRAGKVRQLVRTDLDWIKEYESQGAYHGGLIEYCDVYARRPEDAEGAADPALKTVLSQKG